jgi:hypothetical protein
MTYFRFLKWLLKLNMYTMLITFCVITVPYLTLGPYTYEESVRNMSHSETSINCTSDYIKYMEDFTSQESVDEKVIDFLQGTVSLLHLKSYRFSSGNCEFITFKKL